MRCLLNKKNRIHQYQVLCNEMNKISVRITYSILVLDKKVSFFEVNHIDVRTGCSLDVQISANESMRTQLCTGYALFRMRVQYRELVLFTELTGAISGRIR